jgi:hypothetical protein
MDLDISDLNNPLDIFIYFRNVKEFNTIFDRILLPKFLEEDTTSDGADGVGAGRTTITIDATTSTLTTTSEANSDATTSTNGVEDGDGTVTTITLVTSTSDANSDATTSTNGIDDGDATVTTTTLISSTSDSDATTSTIGVDEGDASSTDSTTGVDDGDDSISSSSSTISLDYTLDYTLDGSIATSDHPIYSSLTPMVIFNTVIVVCGLIFCFFKMIIRFIKVKRRVDQNRRMAFQSVQNSMYVGPRPASDLYELDEV